MLDLQRFCESLLRRLGIDPASPCFYAWLKKPGLPDLVVQRDVNFIYVGHQRMKGLAFVSDPVLVFFDQNGLWYPWRLELPDIELQCGSYAEKRLRLDPRLTHEFCRFERAFARQLCVQGWLEAQVREIWEDSKKPALA